MPIIWGLCCIFKREPVRFRRTTAAHLKKKSRTEQLFLLNGIVRNNAVQLRKAFEACVRLDIGAFRINSELMPLATHPETGYSLEDLPEAERIRNEFQAAREYADEHGIRRSFHPDQFVILNSPRRDVCENSILELRHQAFLAELCGASEINIHGGGVYGDKTAALNRLRREIDALPDPVRTRLTLENDDRSYTVEDLLPVCAERNLPLVYDVHHHRVNPDSLSVEDATDRCARTWLRTGSAQHVHLSSPALPWNVSGDHRPHAEEIDPADFPACWRSLDLVIDVEAKGKETAIRDLRDDLIRNHASFFPGSSGIIGRNSADTATAAKVSANNV